MFVWLGFLGEAVSVGAQGVMGGDRQWSHLTLDVPNRLKEFFFPDSAFPAAAWSRMSTCEDN